LRVDYVAGDHDNARSAPGIVAAIKPQGHITFIDNFDESILPPRALTVS